MAVYCMLASRADAFYERLFKIGTRKAAVLGAGKDGLGEEGRGRR